MAALKTERLQGNIAALRAQMQKLKEIEVQLQATPDKQISLTDPDARAMKSQGTGIVGYNVQTAVDAKHHLIVAHVVTNIGSDRDQLSSVATGRFLAIQFQHLAFRSAKRIGEETLLVLARQQLLARVSDDVAQLLIDPQPASVQGNVGDADCGLLKSGPQTQTPGPAGGRHLV